MSVQTRLKAIEKKLEATGGTRIVLCYKRNGESLNHDGTAFEYPEGDNFIINVPWSLRK